MDYLHVAAWTAFCALVWFLFTVVTAIVLLGWWGMKKGVPQNRPPDHEVLVAAAILMVIEAGISFLMALAAAGLCGRWFFGVPYVVFGLYELKVAYDMWNSRRGKRQPSKSAKRVINLGHKLATSSD